MHAEQVQPNACAPEHAAHAQLSACAQLPHVHPDACEQLAHAQPEGWSSRAQAAQLHPVAANANGAVAGKAATI